MYLLGLLVVKTQSMDISSCEEEQLAKRKIKRKPPPKSELPPPDVPGKPSKRKRDDGEDKDEDLETMLQKELAGTNIQGFAELWQAMPHLADDPKSGMPVCTLTRQEPQQTKRKRRKLDKEFDTSVPLPPDSNPLSRSQKHKEQSEHFAKPMFDEILSRFPYPHYARSDIYDKTISRSALVQSLRDGRGVSIPHLDLATANELLYQAGEFTHAATHHKVKHNFPVCANHLKDGSCVGTTMGFRGFNEGGQPGGVPLMSFMQRHEFIRFLQTGKVPGGPPRPCLACMRHDAGRMVFSLACVQRKRIKDPSEPMMDTYVVDPDSMWQWYRDLKDVKGGYHGAFMLTASDTQWQGFLDSFVMLSYSDIKARKDPVNDRWYLDQSSLIVEDDGDEIDGPHPGQSLENFC
jgi:hypothetical protein